MRDTRYTLPTADYAGNMHQSVRYPRMSRLRQHSMCKKNTKHTLRHFYYILPIIRFQNPRTPMISNIDTQRDVKRTVKGYTKELEVAA